ncbi:MAG: AroM family protein [Bacillota bacterium]
MGLVTIGQSPRPDIVGDLRQVWGDKFRVEEAGALDFLTEHEIRELQPKAGEHALFTALRDGRPVLVARERLIPYLQKGIDLLVGRGASCVMVMCTSPFEGLRADVPLVLPHRVLAGFVRAVLAPGSRVVVALPVPEQVEEARSRWTGRGMQVVGEVVTSPFAPVDLLEVEFAGLPGWKPEGVILDCFGFGSRVVEVVRRIFRGPVFSARHLAATTLSAQW